MPTSPVSDALDDPGDVERAIARVLAAERAAQLAVDQASVRAAASTESARATTRDVAARIERRLKAVRAAFERRTSREVASLDAAAGEQGMPRALSVADLARVDAAVAALARRLTSGGA